ncbi:MAG: hypothetical protein C0610_10090 [Desulfobacteraceae bacterium]|nr:MAG: hypothetical protein C0610_10090 [Desulfobacteraceae bacterium]
MRKRDVKRLSLPLMILMVLAFALMAPSLATAELYSDSGLDLRIPENEELELHFSILYEDTDLMHSNDASYNSYDEQLGYWFEDIPWLGIASEAPLLQSDEQDQGTSIEADTNFDPFSGFLLLRYPNGRLQPFVGIGPTFFISDLRSDTVDSLRHIFMGISYSF